MSVASIRASGAGPIFTRFHERRATTAGIVFLASDESSYVTGASLVVDGGQVAI